MPDNCNSCGDPMEPAASMTSRFACQICSPDGVATRTPAARLPFVVGEYMRFIHYLQIVAPADWIQKGADRTPAPAGFLVHLKICVAEIVATIELGNLRDAAFFCGLAPGIEDLPIDAPFLYA